MICMFLQNPNSVSSLSFIYTFVATYVIMYLNSLEYKTKFIKNSSVIIGVYLSTLPISIYVNGWVSIPGLAFGILLAPVFIIVYTASLFLFPFKWLMNYTYIAFEFILNSFNELNYLVDIKKPPIVFIKNNIFNTILFLYN